MTAARLVRRYTGIGARTGPAAPPQARRPGPIHIAGVDGLTLCGRIIYGPAWRTVPAWPQGDRGMCRRCMRNDRENVQDRKPS